MNTSKSIRRSLVPALVVTLGLVSSVQAIEQSSITVSYRDLDLSSVAGAKALYQRIAGAARTVCGYQGHSFTDQALWNSCYKGAITDAVKKVNSPLLTAVHTGRPVNAATAMLAK